MTLIRNQSNLGKASVALKSLANENRFLILCILHTEGEKSVSALEQSVGLSQSALSQHLARLRKDGLVATRRQAQTIYYVLSSAKTAQIIDLIYALYGSPIKEEKAA